MHRRPLASLLVLGLIVAACASDPDEGDADAGDDSVPATEVGTDPDETPETDPPPATDAPEASPSDDDPGDTVPTTDDPDRDGDGNGEAGEDGDGTDDEDVDSSIVVEGSPHISLAASVTISFADPVAVEITATSDDHVVETPRTTEVTTDHVLPLVGMRPDRTYDIEVATFGEDGEPATVLESSFTTGSLPARVADHPISIIDPDRMSPGFTILEFDTLFIPDGSPSSQYLVAYDAEGEPVWYYENTGALAGVERTVNGTFLMFYWPFGIREVDVLGNVIHNWRPVGTDDGDADDGEAVTDGVDPDQVAFQGGIPALEGNPGDAGPTAVRADWIDLAGFHHEAWPMPNGNVLTLSTTEHELTPEQRATFCPEDESEFNAISDVAVEFDPDGRVVRTWDLWDAIDIDEFPGRELCVTTGIFAGDDNRDWNHANSVIYDPERDAVIISSRHTNQIVAFDHLDDEGPQTQVRWILGDGATMPLDGEQTYYQHAVEVNPDGSLIVYDNGNFRPGDGPDGVADPPFSRAVIYEVDDSSDDPADWSARQVWENVDVDDEGVPAYTTFIGDADVLENGNVLVTHGGLGAFPPGPDDPLSLWVREIVPEGESGGDVVWEMRSVDEPQTVTYRSERIPSFYFGPAWSN